MSIVLGGLSLDPIAADDLHARLCTRPAREGWAVHFCNAYTFALARKDHRYRKVLNASSLRVVDGRPLLWLLKLAGKRADRHLCRGPAFFSRQTTEGTRLPGRHLLIGSSPEVLYSLQQKLASTSVDVVSAYSPPFTDDIDELLRLCEIECRRLKPDIVWIGLGTPKQDYVCNGLANRVQASFLAVGAAFDFLSGNKPEAPQLLRGSGFEWLFRLASEPRRLLPRYVLSFFALALTLAEVWRKRVLGR